MEGKPTGEKILSLLIELLADQHKVKVKYHITKEWNTMEMELIYGGQATLEDLYELHDKKGFEFVVEDGEITDVLCTR